MALPAGIVTTQITFGTAVAMISTRNLGMTVKFTPTTSLVWAATGTVLIADAEGFTADPGTQGSVTLINPDQAGFSDGNGNTIRNWGYKVEATYTDGGTTLFTAPTKYITWAAGDTGPIDLDQMIPVTASSGITVSMPLVTSVNGLTGAVIVSGGSGGGSTFDPTLYATKADPTFTGTLTADNMAGKTLAVSSTGNARMPFNHSSTVDGSTFTGAAPGDVVGLQNTVQFKGGFTREPSFGASNPTFAWGIDNFITTGSNVGDLAGLANINALETEVHLYTPSAVLTNLKGLQVDAIVESSATNASVTTMFGIYVSPVAKNAASATVTNAYGLYIEAPTAGGTVNEAIHAVGAVSVVGPFTVNGTSVFTGNVSHTAVAAFTGGSPANSQGAAAGVYLGNLGGNFGINISDGTNSWGLDVASSDLRFMKAGTSQAAKLSMAGTFTVPKVVITSGTGDGLTLTAPTQTTAPTAGGAAALPATPAGYLQITVGSTARWLPYY